MSNPFGKRRSRAREDALAWLARMKRGLRRGEGPELLAWLRRRSHRRLIAKAAVEWHGPEVLAVLSEIFPIEPARLEPRRGPHPALTVAAVLLGACITLMIPLAIDVMMGIKPHVYTTALAATKRLALQDGTGVELNRGTQVTVLYAEHVRRVLLVRGEALFTVAPEPTRPFHVSAAGRDIETKSATFDVRLTAPDRLSITVIAGTVTVFPLFARKRPDGTYEQVSDPRMRRPILLEPLQMLVIEPDDESGRRVTEQDVRARLSWQRGT